MKYKNLEEVLDIFKCKDEDGYKEYINDNTTEDEEIYFGEALDDAMKNMGIKQYDFTYCGGFCSPGYDIKCYCISYIDLEEKLQTIPISFEIC